MPRIQPLSREAVPEGRELFDHFEQTMGFLPNSLLTLGRRPDIMLPLAQLAQAVLGPSPVGLSAEIKTLAAYVASLAAGCRYCQAHTASTAAERGVAADKIEAAFQYETSPLFDEAERAALRVAQGAASAPNLVDDEDFEALRRHYTDDQILELVAVVALYGFLNRWNDTLATELENRPKALAARRLARSGWDPGKHEP